MGDNRTASLILQAQDDGFTANLTKAASATARFQEVEALATREAKKFADATSKLASYGKLDAKLQETSEKFEQQRAALKTLGESILNTSGSTRKLETSYRTLEERLETTRKLMERQKQQSSELAASYQRLSGQSLNSFSSAQSSLETKIRATTDAMKLQREEALRMVKAEERAATRRQALANEIANVTALAGPGVLHATVGGMRQGATVEHERVRLEALGDAVTPAQRQEMEKQALDLSAKYRTVGQADMMHMMRNAVSITGSAEESMRIADPMARLRVIADAQHPGVSSDEDFDQLIKGLEIKGVTQDPKQFNQYMDGITKGLNAFGDTLKPYQYYEMFKYGRQATPLLSEKFMLGTAPALATELGGSSYGNAISGLNSTIVGGHMNQAAAKNFVDLGLIRDDDVDYTKKTHEVKGLKPGTHVQGWELFQTNPYEWVIQYLVPAMEKKGIKDPSQISAKISALFENRVQAQMIGILATQQMRINKDMKISGGAKGLDSAEGYLQGDPFAALKGLQTSLETFAGVLTSPVMKDAAASLDGLSRSIGEAAVQLGDWQKVHPDAAKATGAAAIGAGLYAGGRWTYGLFEKMFGGGKGEVVAGAEGGVKAAAGGALAKAGAVAGGALTTAGGLMTVYEMSKLADEKNIFTAPKRLGFGGLLEMADQKLADILLGPAAGNLNMPAASSRLSRPADALDRVRERNRAIFEEGQKIKSSALQFDELQRSTLAVKTSFEGLAGTLAGIGGSAGGGSGIINAAYFGTGSTGSASGGSTGASPGGSTSSVVDTALNLQGMGAHGAAAALGAHMTNGEWCADFVNGALAKHGIKGTGSSLAQSFSHWGKGVGLDAAQKGDVGYEVHGRGHGHVMMLTGEHNKQGWPEVVAGNSGGRVKRYFENPSKLRGHPSSRPIRSCT